jgi:hypothetical protein
MMVLSAIDDEAYEVAQVEISYCKLFPQLIEDFITRKDAAEMMKASNLPFTSTVSTNPGQAVQVAVPAGSGTTVSPGTGSGTGQVSPVYNGSSQTTATKLLAKQKEAIKDAGGQATKAVVDTALGN